MMQNAHSKKDSQSSMIAGGETAERKSDYSDDDDGEPRYKIGGEI